MSGRWQLTGRQCGFSDGLHVERKQGKGGRAALGEGWGGALVQGRGGIEDGLIGEELGRQEWRAAAMAAS
jgi:hypothetical protein